MSSQRVEGERRSTEMRGRSDLAEAFYSSKVIDRIYACFGLVKIELRVSEIYLSMLISS